VTETGPSSIAPRRPTACPGPRPLLLWALGNLALGSGILGPVDVAEKVGILANRFGSLPLKEPDQKGQIK